MKIYCSALFWLFLVGCAVIADEGLISGGEIVEFGLYKLDAAQNAEFVAEAYEIPYNPDTLFCIRYRLDGEPGGAMVTSIERTYRFRTSPRGRWERPYIGNRENTTEIGKTNLICTHAHAEDSIRLPHLVVMLAADTHGRLLVRQEFLVTKPSNKN